MRYGATAAELQRLEDALTAAGVRHTCELYDDAAHGFTMADTAVYDEAATERHWERLLDRVTGADPLGGSPARD